MSLSPTTAITAAGEPAWSRALDAPLGMPTSRGVPAQPSAADVKKAASQFETIILRQLLGPSIEPMMNGGLGGAAGGGGGIYGYLLTEVLCGSLGASGGLGLGRMLERQLSLSSAGVPDVSASSSEPF